MTRVNVHVLTGASPSSLSLTLELLETANRLALEAGGAEPFTIALNGSGAGAAREPARRGISSVSTIPAITRRRPTWWSCPA